MNKEPSEDNVALSNVAVSEPLIGKLPSDPVADSVAESNVWDKFPLICSAAVDAKTAFCSVPEDVPLINTDPVEDKVALSRVILTVPVTPVTSVAIRGTRTLNIISHR